VHHARCSTLASLLVLAGCAGEVDPGLDPADECATCAGKADGWGAPDEGSCEARAVVELANEASFAELDDDARLNRRAVEHIFEARAVEPFTTLRSVDDVPYVGVFTLRRMVAYAHESGGVERCEAGNEVELGVIADLDKTVIPPEPGYALPDAPYPGVAALFERLDLGADGSGTPGDVTYVTARSPDRVVGIADWLVDHGLPDGPIETGNSGLPWLAQPEKVRDVSAAFDARPDAPFVLFGDSAHRDPEVYRESRARYPDRVRAGLIHRVNRTVAERRLEGLRLFDDYAEAAAILAGLGVLTTDDAWAVYDAAVAEGLERTEPEMQALLDANAP